MGAKNKVIAGSYLENAVTHSFGKVSITTGNGNTIDLSSGSLKDYEVIDSESRKSASNEFMLDVAGGMLLGPVGILVGLFSKKKGVYVVALEFNDGNKSLIEVNKVIYEALISLFPK